jgi:hypothetical protein
MNETARYVFYCAWGRIQIFVYTPSPPTRTTDKTDHTELPHLRVNLSKECNRYTNLFQAKVTENWKFMVLVLQ